MAIFVTGDTHGSQNYYGAGFDGFMTRLNTMNFPEQKELTKDDYVVICGDFGGVWNYTEESASERYSLDWLEKKPFTTLFVPGNHENYDRLTGLNDPKLIDSWMYDNSSEEEKQKIVSGYPQKLWHGGMVRELRQSVLMLERGFVFNINGKKCFAFGGAASHDIYHGIIKAEEFDSLHDIHNECKKMDDDGRSMYRINHISWWEQEMPSQMEMEMGWAMLEDEKYKVDFIFTHDGPISLVRYLTHSSNPDALTKYFEEVKNKVDYKHWFFAHHHRNFTFPGGKDHVLYEQIIQIA